jgi:hypothetical protein
MLSALLLLGAGCIASPFSRDANRLTYLDESDPYYVGLNFPKLTTPQWVGEPGVAAVVVLAIDDMRGHEPWERYLRPILERLKRLDGRAPVSIMTCAVDPQHPHLQTWLREGLSLETHTIDHPCPLLAGGDLAKAKSTYDRCVDLLASVPGNRPVAFRVPCCDSLNTPSPRFFAEIFNGTTPAGRFLAIDSSVFNVLTGADPLLPRRLVLDDDGTEKFRKYLPADRTFVNTIENYPYPYVIGRLCWEFPCVTPSDWEAQHFQQPNNPRTVADLKAALDAIVLKQGVFCLVFHPHGWIRNDQVIELIDHAQATHGGRIKFLTFREAYDRITANLLAGQPLRAADGSDNGVRLLDLNNDGFQDVLIANDRLQRTRLWSPAASAWIERPFPLTRLDAGAHFGIVDDQKLVLISPEAALRFEGAEWTPDGALMGDPGGASGYRLRDLDRDGGCELIVGRAVYRWTGSGWEWTRADLPSALLDERGRDNGVRFVDLDGDGREELVVSNEEGWSVHRFEASSEGAWRRVAGGGRGEIPRIVRDGTNNGAWFHSGHLWVQNEETATLPDHVDRRRFGQLLGR